MRSDRTAWWFVTPALLVIAALPVFLVFFVRGVNPSYLDPFSSAEGQIVMALCLLSVAVGYGAMLWATRLPEEERVLRWQ